jgi:hypothetical protein
MLLATLLLLFNYGDYFPSEESKWIRPGTCVKHINPFCVFSKLTTIDIGCAISRLRNALMIMGETCCGHIANKTQFLMCISESVACDDLEVRSLVSRPVMHLCLTYRWMLPATCSLHKKSRIRHNSVHTSLRQRTNGYLLNECTFTQVPVRVIWFRTGVTRIYRKRFKSPICIMFHVILTINSDYIP